MKKLVDRKYLLPIAIGAMAAAMAMQGSFGQDNGDEEEEDEELEFDEADLFLELNDTDGDLGLQGFVDGDALKRFHIEGPGDTELLNIWVRNQLRRQGLSEFSFESDEPTFDELSPANFLRRFPQGIYEFEGTTLDDEELESEIFLSHKLAAPPGNITVNGQAAAVGCDAADLPVVSEPVTLDWDPVTQSHPTIGRQGASVFVQHYEVVGEIEREGKIPDELVMSVILPRQVTEFEFPVGFTALAGGEMKWELITTTGHGNKTGVEGCFEIE